MNGLKTKHGKAEPNNGTNFLNKIAIVIQGPSNYVEEVKITWKGFDLIFSTWKGSEDKYNKNDVVIFNEEPTISGPFNFNFQRISSYNGLLKAKELGYTHALKIRSDYLPTNSQKFIELLDFNKMNFLLWHYTSFLWLDFPTLNGYFTDHFSFGPIDYMLEMWDIKDVFCHSPEIMVTWNYISKLKDKIEVNYIITNLNKDNDLFYLKQNAKSPTQFGFNNLKNFDNRKLYGRYESVFQSMPEYKKTPKETKKFMNEKYLNFLTYYTKLPKITILNYNNRNLTNILYPKEKLEIISNKNDITGDYIILSNNIITSATLLIEYFNKENIYYSNTYNVNPNPGNSRNSTLLTKEEFIKIN